MARKRGAYRSSNPLCIKYIIVCVLFEKPFSDLNLSTLSINVIGNKKELTINMNRFGLRRRNGEKEKDFQNRIDKERSKIRQETFRRYRERNRAKLSQRTLKWQHENPEKVELIWRSGHEVRKAIKKGLLTRPDTCEWCGKKHKNIDAAHHDYSKPLDVKWLCRRCHTKWDKGEPKLKWVKNRHR